LFGAGAGFELARSVPLPVLKIRKWFWSFYPNLDKFINSGYPHNLRNNMVLGVLSIVKNGESHVIEMTNKEYVDLMKELLASVLREVHGYLVKDRELMEETTKSYVNYLKRLGGRRLDYNLYLEISNNKWIVKTVRLYIDYFVKVGKINRGGGAKDIIQQVLQHSGDSRQAGARVGEESLLGHPPQHNIRRDH